MSVSRGCFFQYFTRRAELEHGSFSFELILLKKLGSFSMIVRSAQLIRRALSESHSFKAALTRFKCLVGLQPESSAIAAGTLGRTDHRIKVRTGKGFHYFMKDFLSVKSPCRTKPLCIGRILYRN